MCFFSSHDVPHETILCVQHFHVLKPTPESIKFSSLNSLEITLKPDMVYNIGIYDPKFSFISLSHKIIPRAYLHLKQYMGDVTVQLEVSHNDCRRCFEPSCLLPR